MYYNGFSVKQVLSSVMITLFNIVVCRHLGFESVACFFSILFNRRLWTVCTP